MRTLRFAAPHRFTGRMWLAAGMLSALALFAAALIAERATQSKPRYEAGIRRTSHGIPHLTARDWGGLGFGEGYATEQSQFVSRTAAS
ncbi:MAG TPA: penicillin acylase family protein [Blastocatellia bacterium]|nr:penicillin acylase family protein [Blastocatellia bacterium]